MRESTTCSCEVIHDEIVETVTKKALSAEQYVDLATLFKMFGDPSRVRLLHALSVHEMCVCDLAAYLGITKSAVSHQLKILRTSKLIASRREGKSMIYSLADDHVKTIIAMGKEHIEED